MWTKDIFYHLVALILPLNCLSRETNVCGLTSLSGCRGSFNTSTSLLKCCFSPLLLRYCSGQATKLLLSTSPEWVGYSSHGLMEGRISVTMRGTQPCRMSLPWTFSWDVTVASPTAQLSWSSM